MPAGNYVYYTCLYSAVILIFELGEYTKGRPSMSIPSPDPRHAPPEFAVEAPVHILGLKGASVVIVDDQETARLALDEMIRSIDPGISTFLFSGGG